MVELKLAAGLALSLVVASAGVASAADASVGSVKGAKYRMAGAIVADRITVLTDTSGDQVSSDGSAVNKAPKWSDVAKVYVATGKTPAKLRTKMQEFHPPGATDAFYGSKAKPLVGDKIIFVAVEMAKRMPANAKGQLVEVGLAGAEATPVQVGTVHDTRAGVERFSLSGRFTNGATATGDTDIVGKEPGVDLDDADYYNVGSGVYGFYDLKKATWYLAIPRAGTAEIAVSVHSTTDGGQVIDRLALPDGGHFIELKDPAGGFKPGVELPALGCRAIETFSGDGGVELSEVDATLIRYTAGVDRSIGQKKRAELFSGVTQGPVPVTLTPVGSDDAPTIVEGELSLTRQENAVQLTFEAPAGQWRFALAVADELKTPAGELLVDHGSLTGPAGVLTGPGLDGLAAGDLSCVTPDEPGDTAAEGAATGDADPDGADAPAGDAAADDEATEG